LRKRIEGFALRLRGSFIEPDADPFGRKPRTRRIEHHAFRPFLVGVDANVDLLVERDVGI
jgi:hypothetical protein